MKNRTNELKTGLRPYCNPLFTNYWSFPVSHYLMLFHTHMHTHTHTHTGKNREQSTLGALAETDKLE